MTEDLKPTHEEFYQAVAIVLAELGDNYNAVLAANRAFEAECNDLMADCGRKDEELSQAQSMIANLRALNSALHREVQAHRRALADIRQRIVNGETLTVSLAQPVYPVVVQEEEPDFTMVDEVADRR